MVTMKREGTTLSVDVGFEHPWGQIQRFYIPGHAFAPAKCPCCGEVHHDQTPDSWLNYMGERLRIPLGFERDSVEVAQLREQIRETLKTTNLAPLGV